MITTEKRFEADIESFFLSPAGGYTRVQTPMTPNRGSM